MNCLGWSGFEDCYFYVPKPTRIENTLLVVHKVTMELWVYGVFTSDIAPGHRIKPATTSGTSTITVGVVWAGYPNCIFMGIYRETWPI